jgi:hypothetical protein
MNLLTKKKRKSVAGPWRIWNFGIVTIHSWRTFGEIEDEHDSDEELIEKELGDDIFFFRLALMWSIWTKL